VISDGIYRMLASRSLRDFFNSRSDQFATIRQRDVSQFALLVTKVHERAIHLPVVLVPCAYSSVLVTTGWTERLPSVCCLDYKKERRECTWR